LAAIILTWVQSRRDFLLDGERRDALRFPALRALPNLVRFGFSGNLLEIKQLRETRMCKDVMAATRAFKGKTKAADQRNHLSKSYVAKIALSKFFEELAAIQ
jgi:hypothetical protein